jgi:CBS domain containing-hemolysin-like protein
MNQYIETGVLDFETHLREPVIVHENAQVLMVMEQLRQAPLQMAIVLNEYGSIEGVATPIDILEAIAGHVSLLLGRDLVDESEQYSTLSGYILFHLGRLPENGEKLLSDGYVFEIVTMDGHKIEKVHLIQQESSSAS